MVRLKQNLDHLLTASPAAKLTAPVNIAVFAAFLFCIRCVLRSDAEFKPRRGGGNLTFGVMGGKNGKKWQETARNGNEVARLAAKTARFGEVVTGSMPLRESLQARADGAFARCMRLLRCSRRRVTPLE